MERKYLFRVPDMWEKASTPKVVRCIEEIQKLVKNYLVLIWAGKFSWFFFFKKGEAGGAREQGQPEEGQTVLVRKRRKCQVEEYFRSIIKLERRMFVFVKKW